MNIHELARHGLTVTDHEVTDASAANNEPPGTLTQHTFRINGVQVWVMEDRDGYSGFDFGAPGSRVDMMPEGKTWKVFGRVVQKMVRTGML